MIFPLFFLVGQDKICNLSNRVRLFELASTKTEPFQVCDSRPFCNRMLVGPISERRRIVYSK